MRAGILIAAIVLAGCRDRNTATIPLGETRQSEINQPEDIPVGGTGYIHTLHVCADGRVLVNPWIKADKDQSDIYWIKVTRRADGFEVDATAKDEKFETAKECLVNNQFMVPVLKIRTQRSESR